MTGGPEQVQHVAQRRVQRKRDDVGTRHHHVGDLDVVQGQNVLEDRALLRRELGADALERVLDVVAYGSRRQAEQRAKPLEQPGMVFARKRRAGPIRCVSFVLSLAHSSMTLSA